MPRSASSSRYALWAPGSLAIAAIVAGAAGTPRRSCSALTIGGNSLPQLRVPAPMMGCDRQMATAPSHTGDRALVNRYAICAASFAWSDRSSPDISCRSAPSWSALRQESAPTVAAPAIATTAAPATSARRRLGSRALHSAAQQNPPNAATYPVRKSRTSIPPTQRSAATAATIRAARSRAAIAHAADRETPMASTMATVAGVPIRRFPDS